MADQKEMLDHTEAYRRAARVRELKPGFYVTLRLEVALALMKQRDLVVSRWLGDGQILEVKHNPHIEEGESDDTSSNRPIEQSD